MSPAQKQLEELASALEKVVILTEECYSCCGRSWVDDLAIWKQSEGNERGARRLRDMATGMGEELGDMGTWLNSGAFYI